MEMHLGEVSDQNSDRDRISDLPGNLLDNILVFLPLRDAVRTSILSKKWRCNWETIPQLVFNSEFEESLKESPAKNVFFSTIYKVLLLHRGPIIKFTLEISELGSCSEIDHMVQFVSRNGIRDLTLRIISSSEHYRIPGCLFSCLELRRLCLSHCLFQPPVTFNGFSRLVSADFRDVSFGTNVLQNFILKCQLLEFLVLKDCDGIGHLDIYAPKLKYLAINSPFHSICFRDTPILTDVSIRGRQSPEPEIRKGSTIDMLEVFGSLPRVENLFIGVYFLKLLAAGIVPERLPTSLDCLRSLVFLGTSLNAVAKVSFAFCLIKSSPNLKKLKINAFEDPTADEDAVIEFLKVQNQSDVTLYQLQEVEIRYLEGTRSELKFVKLLLAKSPSLRKMIFRPSSININEEVRILKQVNRFPRASTVAKICYSCIS